MPLPPLPALAPNIAHLLWNDQVWHDQRTAVVEPERLTTYAALAARANGYARTLRAIGLAPGDRVAVFLERGAESAAAFFGIAAAGGIAVMLADSLRPRQLEHALGHSEARVLVTTADMLARQPRAVATRACVLDAALVASDLDDRTPPHPRVGGDVAQIIYTSGSTGQPKGIAVSHANLWAGITAVSSYIGITEGDRLAGLLSFSFDYGFNQLLCAVAARATLVVELSPLAQRIVATLRAERVTILPAVPALWLQLLGVADFAEPLPSLRAMTNTGGRIPTEAVRALRRQQPQAQLFLMYGLTEAFRATYLPPEEVDAHPDSIGRAIPGAEILVLRDDGTECTTGEVGELVQRGPTVTLGYWSNPEATAAVFRPHPRRPVGAPDGERVVYSGDLVRRDACGRLFFVGRRDALIKTLGYRVSPDEIADVLHASGEVAEAVVATEPDAVRGERIIAVVVLRAGGALDRLEAFCRRELPRHMVPTRIELREVLPRLASGKYDLSRVRAALAVASSGSAPPGR
jgi:amino acid adenylation domain-containing protein